MGRQGLELLENGDLVSKVDIRLTPGRVWIEWDFRASGPRERTLTAADWDALNELCAGPGDSSSPGLLEAFYEDEEFPPDEGQADWIRAIYDERELDPTVPYWCHADGVPLLFLLRIGVVKAPADPDFCRHGWSEAKRTPERDPGALHRSALPALQTVAARSEFCRTRVGQGPGTVVTAWYAREGERLQALVRKAIPVLARAGLLALTGQYRFSGQMDGYPNEAGPLVEQVVSGHYAFEARCADLRGEKVAQDLESAGGLPVVEPLPPPAPDPSLPDAQTAIRILLALLPEAERVSFPPRRW